jgi:hypothetical protein
MKKTYLKSIVLPIAAIGLCLSILTSALQVPDANPVETGSFDFFLSEDGERSVPTWTDVGGISFRTDSIVAFQTHETREDNSLIFTDGGWEFEVPVPYLRLKESLGQ